MRLVWLAVCVLCLSGCATLFAPTPAPSRPDQVEATPFILQGRVAINYQGQRHSAGVRWDHQLASDEVLLLAPLGQTVARIQRDAQQATLEQGGKHYQAQDMQLLMQQVLGWHLPFTGLHHWLLGLPAPGGEAQIERDALGRVSVLRQDAWVVRYLSYGDEKVDSLPKRVSLQHADLQVQLLIDEWQL